MLRNRLFTRSAADPGGQEDRARMPVAEFMP